MSLLLIGLVIFLASHSLAFAAPALRARLVGAWGLGAYKGLYSLVSVIGLVAIVAGFREARADPVLLWVAPGWMRHVTLLLMVPVFPLVIAAYLNGRIRARLKHPMLVAIKLWAFAHLLVNGRLADLVLFGAILAWAVVDRISLKRRGQAVAAGPVHAAHDAIALLAGLALYALFVWDWHRQLIGVSPLG